MGTQPEPCTDSGPQAVSPSPLPCNALQIALGECQGVTKKVKKFPDPLVFACKGSPDESERQLSER
jgi:hypothetical protein